MKRNTWSLVSTGKSKLIFKAYENELLQDNKSCSITTGILQFRSTEDL